MAIPFAFDNLAKRLQDARSWGGNVTEGNRCAMVLGVALGLRPSGAQEAMRGKPFVNSAVRNQPFTQKFFVKAWDLAEAVLDTWGPATQRVAGNAALGQVTGLKGFVFLEDCWRTPMEKVNKLLWLLTHMNVFLR